MAARSRMSTNGEFDIIAQHVFEILAASIHQSIDDADARTEGSQMSHRLGSYETRAAGD